MPKQKSASTFCLVLVTAPNIRTARRLAQLALKQRLIACANLLFGLQSHYWWQGKIERGSEVLMLCKTTSRCLPRLETLITRQHPYDTPEFLVLKISSGSQRYLHWLKGAVNETNARQ